MTLLRLRNSPYGWVYPDEKDGKMRVLTRIGDASYFVIYWMDENGVPVAEATHVLRNGQYVAADG